MGEPNLEALSALAGRGRTFSTNKKSRIQDTTIDGRIRLDAIARIVSEVSEEDLIDLGCPNTRWWMARKIVIEVLREGVGQQQFVCQTWAGGMAHVAAERRVALSSDDGAAYETSTTWISIDAESGRPAALPQWFADEYAAACDGRKASIRSTHPSVIKYADEIIWPLRQVDFDQHRHVNNGAYWPVIEEIIARYSFDRTREYRVEIEFRSGVPIAPAVTLRVDQQSTGLTIWWIADDSVAASATIDYLPN